MKNYYQILGLSFDATQEEIKAAYLKLSKKFHPDMNNQDQYFENMFKEILEAYNTLYDFNQRLTYDVQYKKNFQALKQEFRPDSQQAPYPQTAEKGRTGKKKQNNTFKWLFVFIVATSTLAYYYQDPLKELYYQIVLDKDDLFYEANTLIKKGQYNEAVDSLKIILKKDKNKGTAAGKLGSIYLLKKDYKNSLKYYKKAEKAKPGSRKIIKDLTRVYIEQKDYKKAALQYEKLLGKKKGKLGTYLKVAELYQLAKDYHKALDNYDHALQINGDNTAIYAKKGIIHAELQDFSNATDMMKRAIKSDQGNETYKKQLSLIYNLHGETLKEKGNYKKALGLFKKALNYDKQSKVAYNNIGLVCFYNKNYDKAVKMYKRALVIDSDFLKAAENLEKVYHKIGIMERERKKYKAALKNFKWAGKATAAAEKKYHGEMAETYELMGRDCKEHSDQGAALKYFREALRYDGKNRNSLRNLGMIYFEQEKYSEAKGYLTKAAAEGDIRAAAMLRKEEFGKL